MILRLALLAATVATGTSAVPAFAAERTELDALRQLVASMDFAQVAPATTAYGHSWELKLLAIEAQVRARASGLDDTVTGSIPRSE